MSRFEIRFVNTETNEKGIALVEADDPLDAIYALKSFEGNHQLRVDYITLVPEITEETMFKNQNQTPDLTGLKEQYRKLGDEIAKIEAEKNKKLYSDTSTDVFKIQQSLFQKLRKARLVEREKALGGNSCWYVMPEAGFHPTKLDIKCMWEWCNPIWPAFYTAAEAKRFLDTLTPVEQKVILDVGVTREEVANLKKTCSWY